MRFKFGLQALLNWKKDLETLSRMRLAEKNREMAKQEESIQALTRKRVSVDEELMERSTGGMAAAEYLLYKDFAEGNYREIASKEGEKEKTIHEIDEERTHLVGLLKERKMLDKLRDKRYRRFQYEEEKTEQKENDEMVITRYKPSRST